MWYHTREGRLWAEKDIGIGLDSFTPFQVVNPNDPSEMITIYDLNPGVATGNVFTVSSDIDKRTYNGFELSAQARLDSGGTILGGWYTDRQLAVRCDRNDPNELRFCDETGNLFQETGIVESIPFRHEFKLAITHPLPYGFEGALSFISYPGTGSPVGNASPDGADRRWRDIGYTIPNALYPGGGPASGRPALDARLIAPGTGYFDRWNQLDISIKRRFRSGGLDILPTLDLYNLNNSSVVLAEDENFGNNLGRPLTIIGGRLMRLGVQLRF